MSNLLFDRLHTGLGQVLDLRARQHELTAGNLANADTPGYKAKFIPFDEVLHDAVHADSGSLVRDLSGELRLSVNGGEPEAVVEEVEAPEWAEDGNSVRLEKEESRLIENSLMFNGLVSGLSRRLSILRFASGDGS